MAIPALVAVALLLPVARIGINPMPPTVGGQVTFSGPPNSTIEVEYPPLGVFKLRTDANGEAVDVVPAGAFAVIVSDPAGTWQSNTSMVRP